MVPDKNYHRFPKVISMNWVISDHKSMANIVQPILKQLYLIFLKKVGIVEIWSALNILDNRLWKYPANLSVHRAVSARNSLADYMSGVTEM